MTPRTNHDEFASDAQERMSGARLRAARQNVPSSDGKPSLLVVGDETLRPLLELFGPNEVDLRWIRELDARETVFDDARFDMVVVHVSALAHDTQEVWASRFPFARCRQVIFIGEMTNLPPAFAHARTPLVLSSHVPLARHYAAIRGLFEVLCDQSPVFLDPSRTILTHLTKELANLSMAARPAWSALEELAQKDTSTLELATILANSWNRIDDCLRDVTTLLDSPTERPTTHTSRVLERFVDDHIENVVSNQRFLSRLAQSLWSVHASEPELQLLCKLLLANARSATARGGEILLEADNATIRQSLSDFPELVPSDYVRIRICDSGIGMTQSTQRRAKEPFYSTFHTDSNWKGLGLAQADAICRRSLGALTIRTREGQGTIVTAWLRRSELAIPVPSRSPLVEVAPTSKFLLVDNEPSVLASLANGLSQRGHSVLLAQDAVTALSILEDESDCDFAVIDLHLDRNSGLVLARTLAEKTPHLRITLCSGFADIDLSKELSRPASGSFGYLRKPFNACELLNALRVFSDTNGEE